ncbi:MAG TPA: EVE domain-containing protein [Thermoanaerobaculia bacterium]|jgi:predicted RNA-binding protein with PUA-like domain|nr:EVE domain-containing protein [Thermoanaerobaculia bacterium]
MAQRVTPYKSGINYWLLVADPDDYSYADLERNTAAVWNRVKDYASLKHLRDVDSDEEVLFFHGGTELAIVGIARVTSDPYPDPQGTSADEWVLDIVPERRLESPVPLTEIENLPELQDLDLVSNPDLTFMPVTPEMWNRILELSEAPLALSTQENQE